MISILLFLSLAGPAMAVKGTSIYYHTEGSCKEGHRGNANYDDYSVEAGIGQNKCWPREVESNTKDGARRKSIWVAPPIDPYTSNNPHCLWSYPADNAADNCTSDGVVIMTIYQQLDIPVCYNIGGKIADDDEVFGSFWIVSGACEHPTVDGSAIVAKSRDAYNMPKD